jgi:hypothetical protein
LAVRHNDSGEYINMDELAGPSIFKYLVSNIVEQVGTEVNAFVDSIVPQVENREGYTIRLASGQRVKIKTTWYYNLHPAYSSALNSNQALFAAVVEQTVDNLRAQFCNSPEAFARIQDMKRKSLGSPSA